MNYLFYGCSSLIYLPDISKWNISSVEDMSNLFYGCSSLSFLPDISLWKLNFFELKSMIKECINSLNYYAFTIK